MNKSEFLRELTAALAGLPVEERQAALKYYEEYFEEAGTEHEPEILAELGSPEQVAKSILRDYSTVPVLLGQAETAAPSDYRDASYRPGAGFDGGARSAGYQPNEGQKAPNWRNFWNLPTWAVIVICVCAAPIALPVAGGLISAAFGVLVAIIGGSFGLFGGAVGIVIAIIAAMIFLGLAGVLLIIGGISSIIAACIHLVTNPIGAVLAAGVGLLLIALGLVICLVGGRVSKWTIRTTGKGIRWACASINKLLHKGGSKV